MGINATTGVYTILPSGDTTILLPLPDGDQHYLALPDGDEHYLALPDGDNT